MIQCIIFDMDGVLINTEPVNFRVWKQNFMEHGVDVSYDVYKNCIGSTAGYLYDLVEKAYGVSLHQDPTVRSRFMEIKDEFFAREGVPEIAGVRETIPKLQKAGFLLAVASSSPQNYIEFCTDAVGIGSYFILRHSAEHVKNPKPAPDVFLAVAEELGIEPEKCLVVEDSKNGTIAAKSAGMSCIGYVNPDSGNQDLSAADRTICHFSELADLLICK